VDGTIDAEKETVFGLGVKEVTVKSLEGAVFGAMLSDEHVAVDTGTPKSDTPESLVASPESTPASKPEALSTKDAHEGSQGLLAHVVDEFKPWIVR
jgi:hypothetical protein